ncbi:MAG: lipid-A-disaccharide synthase [Bacteroidales bacterium]|nr:lipid-A-disaccharide synthase [Bacteroidales bacterium]
MKYYVIAGEASGDLHGANLMRALKEQDPAAEFRFWGGDGMAAVAGAAPVRHIRDLAIMGFVEVAVHLRTVLGNIAFCKRDIAAYRPDVVVGIDYPGFNLKIERWAKEQGFRTAHYISPNLWAWKKGRLKGMRRSLDLLCYILPFEQRFFAENNMPQAKYVGHPLLDAVKDKLFEPAFQGSRQVVALLPGSRRQELKRSLPLMVQLADRHPEYRFIVAGMSLLGDKLYRSLIPEGSNVEVVYDQTYPLLASAYAAVVCSGTATLETALFNVPQVVCYRANPLSIAIAKSIVSRRIRYISLVNLIADSTVVTELIQDDFNPARLEREFQLITADDANRDRMFAQYADMRKLLSGSGASQRTAQAIIDLVK